MQKTGEITLKVDVSEALDQIEEVRMLRQMHDALPILINAVRRLPDADSVLREWDESRKYSKEGL